jgi:hypothetical protein
MDDNWLYLEGKRGGRAWAAGVRVPFGPTRWPEFDHQVTVVLDYTPHWRTGLPKNADELTRLQAFEDRMIEAIGDLGAVVATETSDMRRTIHLRLPQGHLLDSYRRWAAQRNKGVAIAVEHDPEWAAVEHLAQVAARAA